MQVNGQWTPVILHNETLSITEQANKNLDIKIKLKLKEKPGCYSTVK
jgi:hypothetical protein